jgi:hypothetical protein
MSFIGFSSMSAPSVVASQPARRWLSRYSVSLQLQPPLPFFSTLLSGALMSRLSSWIDVATNVDRGTLGGMRP